LRCTLFTFSARADSDFIAWRSSRGAAVTGLTTAGANLVLFHNVKAWMIFGIVMYADTSFFQGIDSE
jgi:hypothetical protein